MKHWKNILAAGAVVSVAGLAQTADAATYNYVGSWKLGEGPDWRVADALTGQEAAALLFGGTAADYVISTVSDLVADIDFMTWVDTYAQPWPYTATKVAQDYVNDNGDGLYNASGETTAYVSDHFGGGGEAVGPTNYAFRIAVVPLPAGGLLLLTGIGGLAALRRRKKA